jgi:hypothetical protein
MPFVKGRRKTGGRTRGTRNRRTLAAQPQTHPDALEHLAGVVASKDPLITPELKVRAAAALAQYQHSKPAGPRPETFVTPINFEVPRTIEEARERVLELGGHLAKGAISVELHDALIGGIRVYLSDRASEQQRRLDELEAALRSGDER